MGRQMTAQERMQALLEKTGIPAKEIKCYGSQIVITCLSRSAAERWVGVLSKFARVRKPVESIAYAKDQAAAYARLNNPGLVKSVMTYPVWLVGATL